MIAYVECPPALGRGIHRVVTELKAHAPVDVTFTTDQTTADHIVHHVVGVQNFSPVALPALIAAQDRPYSIIQYCLKTTEWGDGPAWTPLWDRAACVWSYYDLRARTAQAYYAPLGVSAAFTDRVTQQLFTLVRPFRVGTSGYVAETEYVDAWVAALDRVPHQQQFHLGPPLPCFEGRGFQVCRALDVSDATLAHWWGLCEYVNGLRAVEGFELPAAEGLVMGARPVLFDRPDHRHWFEDHAVYLQEGSTAEVTEQLEALLQRPHAPVPLEERAWAATRFAWPALVGEFWARVLAAGS